MISKIQAFSLTLLVTLMAATFTGSAASTYRDHRYSSFTTLPECEEGDILFVGNSITNMMDWWEAFGSRSNIRGRGNSGTTSNEILDHFDDIVKGKPEKVFFMIGTNDLSNNSEFNSPDSVAGRIIELIERTKAKVPGVKVYYQSILPTLRAGRTKAKTEKANAIVNEWIQVQNDPTITYIDLYTPMVDDNGSIKNTADAPDPDALSYDDLHLTQKGYQLWLDIIKDYVGYEPVFGKNAINLAGGLPVSFGMRTSQFGALPVKSTDILLIGDEMIHNGDWQERLKNTDIKDRGTGWGFPGISLAAMEGMFDPILSGNVNNGVVKETPRAVALYGGTGEVQRGMSSDSLFAAYSHAIHELRDRLPDTPIFAMTLLPFPTSQNEKNRVIAEFNQRVVNEIAVPGSNIELIDLYTVGGGQNRSEQYFMDAESPFNNGTGYEAMADAIRQALNGLITLSDYSLLPEPQSINFGKDFFSQGR